MKESARWMKLGRLSCIKAFLFCIFNFDDKCISKEKKTVFKRVIPNQIIDKSKSKTKLNFYFFQFAFFFCRMHFFWIFQVLHIWSSNLILSYYADRIIMWFLWQVQIRPWNLSDSDFVMDGSQPLDPRKTIFVGGVPRPLRAGNSWSLYVQKNFSNS